MSREESDCNSRERARPSGNKYHFSLLVVPSLGFKPLRQLPLLWNVEQEAEPKTTKSSPKS